MAGTYTKRLYEGNPVERTLSGPVPNGKVWVVRCIDVVPGGTSSGVVQVGVAYGAWFWIASLETTHSQWQGRQVLMAGEQLNVEASGSAMCMITGYELSQD